MEESILRLLKSRSVEDVLIGLALLSKLDDPRHFMKTYGRICNSQTNQNFEHRGLRYEIQKECWPEDSGTYYKINDSYYILFGYDYDITECYANYSESVKVVEL